MSNYISRWHNRQDVISSRDYVILLLFSQIINFWWLTITPPQNGPHNLVRCGGRENIFWHRDVICGSLSIQSVHLRSIFTWDKTNNTILHLWWCLWYKERSKYHQIRDLLVYDLNQPTYKIVPDNLAVHKTFWTTILTSDTDFATFRLLNRGLPRNCLTRFEMFRTKSIRLIVGWQRVAKLFTIITFTGEGLLLRQQYW